MRELIGASKTRANAVLEVAEKRFNLKTLVTEANLKKIGILSEKVGTICKFRKFRNGIPIESSSEDDSDNEQEGTIYLPVLHLY